MNPNPDKYDDEHRKYLGNTIVEWAVMLLVIGLIVLIRCEVSE